MICGHPQCNGKHDANVDLIADVCPVAADKRRKSNRLRAQRYSLTTKGMLAAIRKYRNRLCVN